MFLWEEGFYEIKTSFLVEKAKLFPIKRWMSRAHTWELNPRNVCENTQILNNHLFSNQKSKSTQRMCEIQTFRVNYLQFIHFATHSA